LNLLWSLFRQSLFILFFGFFALLNHFIFDLCPIFAWKCIEAVSYIRTYLDLITNLIVAFTFLSFLIIFPKLSIIFEEAQIRATEWTVWNTIFFPIFQKSLNVKFIDIFILWL
jgi:hypothetical protein